MKFGHPFLINLLWVLIPILGMMIYGLRQRKKIIDAYLETKMLSLIAPGYNPGRRWIKLMLVIAALGFAVFALSEPQVGFRWEKIEQKGVDIMIALDCSKSMLAQDIKPNRLERAKREIIDLLSMMKSDRAGLVAFSGNALLQCPLTMDYEAFHLFLRVLEPGFLPMGGTNLSEAIQTSFNGFEKDSDTQKAIILITDGETTSGDVEKIAKQMAKENIKIFCIGVGDPQGAPIPDETGGFKKDSAGNIILSKVDEKGLQRLADLTDGAYVQSVAGDMDLDLIYSEKILGTMTRKTLTSGKKKVWENRYQWFLFPCFLLLLIELAISSGKRNSGKMIVFVWCILFSFQAPPVRAESVFSSVTKGITAFTQKEYELAKKHFIDAQLEQPDNPKHYYNIGTAAFMNREFDQAERNFIQAAKSTDPQMNHDALYNLANTYYKMDKLDESIKGYEHILEKYPEDIQAKENLEFVKMKKKEKQSQENSENKNPNEKDQENRDQDNKDDKQGDDNNGQEQDQKKQQNQQGKKAQEDKEKSDNKDSLKDKDKDQPENQPKEQNSGSDNRKEQEDQRGQLQAWSEEEKEGQQAKQNLENKLNRLEDKPGQAMMPFIQDRYVEKDW